MLILFFLLFKQFLHGGIGKGDRKVSRNGSHDALCLEGIAPPDDEGRLHLLMGNHQGDGDGIDAWMMVNGHTTRRIGNIAIGTMIQKGWGFMKYITNRPSRCNDIFQVFLL